MAKINQSAQRKWNDGDVIHGAEYNQERDLIVAAHNDTQDQVDALKSTTTPAVSTGMLQDLSVTNPKLADNAVTSTKIQDGSVLTGKLADQAVTGGKIAAGTITSGNLGDQAVTAPKLADGAVTVDKLAQNSVATDRIQNEAVTEQKIAPGAVTSAKILAQAILSSHMSANSVGPDAIVPGAVGSTKLEDGAVTPTKITKEAITQYAYDMATTDQRIADALSAGVPQEVIDEIRNSISADVGQLRTDVGDMQGIPPGMSLTGAFLDVNGTVNTHIYDEEIHVTQALQDSWNAKPTTDEMQRSIDDAMTIAGDNANSYANANFYNKSRMDSINMVRNGTALFGLTDWTTGAGTWTYAADYSDAGGAYFLPSATAADGTHVYIQSSIISVSAGGTYRFGATFLTSGGLSTDAVRLEVVGNSSGTPVLATIFSDPNKWWHRKTASVTIPAGVNGVWLRCAATGPLTNPTSTIRGFSKITFTGNSVDADYYDHTGDFRSLFSNVSNGKTSIASAITGKGVAASGSDTFNQLASKIGQISTGSRTVISAPQSVQQWGTGTFSVGSLPPGKILSFYPNRPGYSDTSNGAYIYMYNTSGAGANAKITVYVGLKAPSIAGYYNLGNGSDSIPSSYNSGKYAFIYDMEISNGVITPGVVQARVRNNGDWTAWTTISTTISTSETHQIVLYWSFSGVDTTGIAFTRYCLNGTSYLV